MTNIEFLVDELRKANETISELRKANAELLSIDFRRKVNEDYNRHGNFDALEPLKNEIEALAALKKKLQETV